MLTIACAVDSKGRSPGKDFFDALPDQDKAKLMHLFRLLGEQGRIIQNAMKTRTQFEQLMESPEFRKLYAIEGLITEAGEFIARLMQEQGVTKAELARRLGKSRAYITQMLSGSANLTVRTLAEVAYALGAEVKLEAVPVEGVVRQQAQAELRPPVWKVIDIRRPPTRADREVPPSRPLVRPSHETASAFHYVA